MGRSTTPDEIKAAALADLQAGEQPAIVAERYRLNRQTVKAWRARLQPEVQPRMQPEVQPTTMQYPAVEDRQARIANLVIQNLEAKLIATQRIAEHAQNSDWLRTQSASDVAELFESLDKSALGILDRLASRAESTE